ncbi:MAG: flagellar hook-length control protein FliK [Dehalococcoidia bacterium]
MTIDGLTTIGSAPTAEGIPPPQGAANGDPFAHAFAAAVGANAGKTGTPGTASNPSMPPGLLVDPNQPWLALLGTPPIEGAPSEQGAVEIARPDRSAEADIEDAMMASTLALAGLLGLERPVVAVPSGGSPSGANGDVAVLVVGMNADADGSMPLVALEVTADGGDVPAPAKAEAGATGIDVSGLDAVDGGELSLPKPEAGANRAAVADLDVPANARAGAQAAVLGAEGIEPRRPAERLGELLQDVAPADRSEVASAWNRAGGRTDIEATSDASFGSAFDAQLLEAADQSAPADVADAPSGTDVDASTADDAAQIAAAQPRTEVATAATSTVDATIEAGNERQLVRGLADTVHRATRAGENELRLVLNPPELGRLDVRIEHGQNGVRIHLAADTAGAHDLIQQHLPALRAALEARDLRVDRIDVQTADSSSNLGDSGDQTQRRQDGGDDEQPRWSGVAAMERAEQQATGEAASVTTSTRGGNGLLDLVA